MSTASGLTPNYGLPHYTSGDYGDTADIPGVLNEVTDAVDGVLKQATDDVGVQASAVVAGQTTAAFLLMGV